MRKYIEQNIRITLYSSHGLRDCASFLTQPKKNLSSNSIDLQLFLAVSGALFLPVRAVVMASQRGLDLDAVSLWDITIMALLLEGSCAKSGCGCYSPN